jgi:hypothetical protein
MDGPAKRGRLFYYDCNGAAARSPLVADSSSLLGVRTSPSPISAQATVFAITSLVLS